MDWRLHFYPWFNKASYRMSREGCWPGVAHQEHRDFAANLENKHGIKLDDQQKAWWVKKGLLENMGRSSHPPQRRPLPWPGEPSWRSRWPRCARQARIGVCQCDHLWWLTPSWDFGVDDS